VIDRDDNDSERAQQIKTELTRAIRETRVYVRGRRSEARGQRSEVRGRDKKNPLPKRVAGRQRVTGISYKKARSYFFLV
jgi:hypothetical protein